MASKQIRLSDGEILAIKLAINSFENINFSNHTKTHDDLIKVLRNLLNRSEQKPKTYNLGEYREEDFVDRDQMAKQIEDDTIKAISNGVKKEERE